MAKLTSPRVTVSFTELGISAITRGDKGTVAVLVRDAAEIASWVKSQRLNNGTKYKAVLPNHPADN